MKQDNPERMQCMEVWGGNQAVERSVETAGLKIWVYSRPYGKAHSGGDVHYLSSCASGRITRMLLADVSGHGEAVSQVAVALRDLMRRNVNYIQQTRFVRAMNQQFNEFGEHDLFATALVTTFFAPTQTFSLCSAGHPPPLIYRHVTSTWSTLVNDAQVEQVSDTPFGILDAATYGQLDVRLEAGDMVLSYSDAVTESTDATGQQLSTAGILSLLHELCVGEPERVIPSLVDQITSINALNLQQDDVTILLIQATGGGPTLKNNLLAPFRLLGQVSDKTELGEHHPFVCDHLVDHDGEDQVRNHVAQGKRR